MLGYYPNSNAKPTGSNLNKKIQTLISLTFNKHLCWLTYIETSKSMNKHKQTLTKNTFTHICTYKQVNIHILTHVYIHTYINTNIYTQIHTDRHTHYTHTHIYIYMCVCVCVCVCVCMYIYITCVCIYLLVNQNI